MKALSLLQPWASLVVHGVKRIETRSWQTRYRGPLAIHAGRTFRSPQRALCTQYPFHSHLAAGGIHRPSNLPLGAIVGFVTLIDCVPASDVIDDLEARERPLGDYRPGRFAWLLAEPIPLAVPVTCAGQLGVYKVSATVAALLDAARR